MDFQETISNLIKINQEFTDCEKKSFQNIWLLYMYRYNNVYFGSCIESVRCNSFFLPIKDIKTVKGTNSNRATIKIC